MKLEKFIMAGWLLLGWQSLAAANDIPPQYLEEALRNNLVLKEKTISLEKSLLALKTARSLFLPTTRFEAQYLLSKGGRTIDIPVGDLMNPVYKTLNELTGSNNFPTISNVSEQFNPNNFYDLRIRTSMPLYNPELKINRAIQEKQVALQHNEIDIYKRELVRDVKTAYFNYLAASKAIVIYDNALLVVRENLRVNQSMLANGKGLPAYVSRAESELMQVENQLRSASNDRQNAKAYFNFLLNKPLTDTIAITEPDINQALLQLPSTEINDVSRREELKKLSIARDINQQVLKMNQSFRVPRLNAFLDLAAQGFDFELKRKSFFYLGGLQLNFPIFTGKRNLYTIEQTRLDGRSLQLTTDQAQQQLQLAAFVSRNAINTANSSYRTALRQESSARQYFKLIDRGYKEGVNNFIEFLDARTQLTNAQLQVTINTYKVFAAMADYERQSASYSFQ
ncbi:TolC family protein [Flavihumibacter stibioxidans]|uniref:Outer membrane protein TolC n=1 Tax=Flavihumibacter stibioxidans TaxID=1834163 RepID=A0ABR7MCB2_9BACT|nr:TolC family protein [Flavihumibacter stibioxidans]MBC6492676.1 hypothetical protein [Flavihumibacter stibioxidans]